MENKYILPNKQDVQNAEKDSNGVMRFWKLRRYAKCIIPTRQRAAIPSFILHVANFLLNPQPVNFSIGDLLPPAINNSFLKV